MSLPHQWLRSGGSPKPTPFSRAILMARREKGLSQKELARLLNIDYVLLSKIENARVKADVKLVPLLALHLGLGEELMKLWNQSCGAVSGSLVR